MPCNFHEKAKKKIYLSLVTLKKQHISESKICMLSKILKKPYKKFFRSRFTLHATLNKSLQRLC